MAEPIKIQIDWPLLLEWSEALQAIIAGGHLDVFEAYKETAAVIANHALITYQSYLKGSPLPNGKAVMHPSGNLAHHAELKEGAGFCEWSLENEEKYAEAIEKGTKQRDLKEILPTAKKTRRAKDGTLYLIIPFQHGKPGAVGLKPMPARIAKMAEKLTRSAIVGTKMEKSGTGFMVQRNVYKWGTSLKGVGGKHEGMYKFGNAGHTSYLTFRVMSQKSSGWVLPPREGLWPAKTAAQVALEDSAGLLTDAVLEDLMRLAGA